MNHPTGTTQSAIRWSAAFSVRIERLDQQHRALFAKVANLSNALSRGEGGLVVDAILAELVEYANYHFLDEESLMVQHDFPSVSSHRAEHDQFRKQISSFLEDHKSGKVGVPSQLLFFMQRWLKHHVMHTDKQYSTFLNSYGVH
jgi:hemerythrin